MPRPKTEQPTPGELEVLHVLWEQGPLTVREVMDRLHAARPRAYTSVMSLMNVMTDKGLLQRKSKGRAFVYSPRLARQAALGEIVRDVLGRAFGGSASALVMQLLEESQPSATELDLIREAIDAYAGETQDADPPATRQTKGGSA